MEINKRRKTIKHIRWKGGERVRSKVDGWKRNKKLEIEGEVMEGESKTEERTKFVESIESPRFN
jgi:hypothetical protein